MGEDPRQNRRGIRAGGQDRGTFDDLTAGAVRAGQPTYQGKNRVIVHAETP
jgi:hypothetical protein